MYTDSLDNSQADHTTTGNRVDIDADLLVDVLPFHGISSGLIAGIFAGYNSPTAGLFYGINLGWQVTFLSQHRIELVVKPSFNGLSQTAYYGASLGYTYTF